MRQNLLGISFTHLARLEIVHFNVTANPNAQWTAQQLTEAFPYDEAPKYLIRDRNGIYGKDFCRRVQAMSIKEVIIAPQSLWQNPFAERVISSIRRVSHGYYF